MRKTVDYFCHLAVKPDFYSHLVNDKEFQNSKYADKIKWLASDYDDIYDSKEDDENYEEVYSDVEITENDLWITSDQVRELLKYNGDYSDLPNNTRRGVSANPQLMQEIKKVNHIAEHHATNREKLFKSAIYLLSKYPDECRGERKEISPEKWRDCILTHKDEIPPLTITNENVILKHLRSAANGKV